MPRQLTRSLFASTQQATSPTRSTRRAKALAVACAVENLEIRQLFAVSVGINFQPANAPVPAGYLADSGAAYAARGNGYTYGWNASHSGDTRDRNIAADQRYDTTILTQLYGAYTWEMAVPNGTYRVHAVAGDALHTDSVYKFNAEGQLLVNGTPTDSNRFVEGTATVTVTDGRLTLSNANGSQNNKLAFVDITGIDVPAAAGVTYLSDMTPVSATNGWGPVEKDMSNGEQAAGDGRVLNLGGTTYPKGLGVHANSSVVYNLAGKYQTFKADIGVDNEATSTGSVVFQVLADGRKIYDSGLMTKATGKKSLSLAVAGVTQLTLVVTDGANGNNNDHADWANAQLIAATTPTPTPTPSAPAAPSNLAATALSPTQVKLTWTDNSSDESGFRVERSTDGTTFTSLATIGANVTTHTDTTAAASTKYSYRVVAVNAAGSSPASGLATVTTPSATPTITANYVVSTTGSDSANGSAASPFRTVAKAMSVAQPGDVILVKNGTYRESLSLTRSGAAGKPIKLVGESTSGVVFDGSGRSSVIAANGAQYITISNITVRYAANGPQNYQAAVKTGSNWTLQDMVVEKVDGTAICAYGSNVTIQRVIAQDNGVSGIGGDGASNLLIKDSITRRNNRGLANPVWAGQTTIGGWPAAQQVNGLWYMNPDFEAGGGKYWKTSNVTIDGLQAYDNVGPGIWFDYQSTNVTIRNCKSFNNRGISSSKGYQGNGMRFELQDQGPFLVENNLVYGNSGQAISIEQARNITIRNNTLVGGAVLFRDANRGAQYAIYNINITGNQIKNGFFETWDGTWNSSSGSTKRITIDGNTYDNGGAKLFSWGGTSYSSLSTIRSTLGFEANGRLGTVTVTY